MYMSIKKPLYSGQVYSIVILSKSEPWLLINQLLIKKLYCFKEPSDGSNISFKDVLDRIFQTESKSAVDTFTSHSTPNVMMRKRKKLMKNLTILGRHVSHNTAIHVVVDDIIIIGAGWNDILFFCLALIERFFLYLFTI